MYKKKSLFQRIKKTFQFDDTFFEEDDELVELPVAQENKKDETVEKKTFPEATSPEKTIWEEAEDLYGELSVDVYHTDSNIIIQAMIAGVKPESLEITISRDMVIIKGTRDDARKINEEDFFIKELYWGTFARTIALSQEIDPEMTEAIEKYGLLTLKLPKIDRTRRTTVKVKSL